MIILTTDPRDFGLAATSLIIVGWVVRAYMRRVKGEPGRLKALEVKVETTKEGVIKADARIVDLEKLFEERTSSMDNKMDIVLQETKEARGEVTDMRDMILRELRIFGERMRGAEKDIEHAQEDIRQLQRERAKL